MTAGPANPRCAIGRLHTTRLGAREAAKAGYRETGVVVIFPDQLTDPFERQFIANLANRLYGEPKAATTRPAASNATSNRRRHR